MIRKHIVPAVLLTLTVAAPLHADVKKEERNQVAFSGILGRMFNFFGGRSAKEGVVSTVAVSGDRKMMTTGDNTAQIVDLREEKIYDLDMRRKTYNVTTFEEIRRQLREAEAKAREAAARESKEEPRKESAEKPKEMEVDVDIKNTGQTKSINGYDTRQVVATITVREKGRKLEDSGGIVMTVDTWLTKAVSLKEIGDFERRYWEKIAAGQVSAVNAQQMATAMAMFPGLKEALARLSKEDFGGTSIQSTTTIDAVKSAEQMKQQASDSSASRSETQNPASIGGAIGGFMKRRQQQKEQETQAAANANPARSTFMTMNNEVLKIATNVTAADVALPEGFKESN